MRQYTGFSWVFEKEEQAIILEDDCIPNLDFFRYCDEMLEKYKDDERALTAAVKMNRQEINNYLKMSRNDAPSEDDVDYFFSALNDRSKRNLIRAVAMKLASDNSKETK